jgi:quercetin dioxygenase-like cupin family protein
MTLRVVSFIVNIFSGGVYTFENAGDVLPMHTHKEGESHITVVVCGKIKVHGDGWENEYLENETIDFPANQAHEFIALEDNTRIVNIRK